MEAQKSTAGLLPIGELSMNALLRNCLGQTLDDIVLYGLVDTDDQPADFTPDMDSIFLSVGGSTIRLQREDEIRLSISDTLEAPIRFELEEGHLLCRSSIGTYALGDPNSAYNQIIRITLYGEKEDTFSAIELTLESGQMLFFDPSFIDGINFGGAEQKTLWFENTADHSFTTIE